MVAVAEPPTATATAARAALRGGHVAETAPAERSVRRLHGCSRSLEKWLCVMRLSALPFSEH